MIVILGKDILPSTSATISTVLRIRKNVLLTLALLRQFITMPPIIHTRNKRNIIYISEAANADTSVVAVSYPVSSAKNPNIERPPIIHAATTNNNSKKFLLFSFLLSIIPPFALLSQLWRQISINIFANFIFYCHPPPLTPQARTGPQGLERFVRIALI